MTNVSKFYSSASFVFASETTPAQAMKIHAAVVNFAPSTALQAWPEHEWHYGDEFGFQYTKLDSDEPVQAALKKITNARDARISSMAQTSQSTHFNEPLGYVLIVLAAIGGGVASEIGKDLWTGVKNGMKWLWRRGQPQNDEGPSAFMCLFDDLSCIFDNEVMWNPVILLQIPQVRLTFVVEPRLPQEAIRSAEWLILRPKNNKADLPLRWHRDKKRWLSVKSAILSEEALQELRREIYKFDHTKPRQFLDREE